MPNYKAVIHQFIDMIGVTDREINNGILKGYNFEFFYWLILSFFSIIFGKFYLFSLLVLLKFLNVIYLFKLTPPNQRNVFFILIIIYYTENYTFQSRFLSGHIPFLIIYFLTPMLIFNLFRLHKDKKSKYYVAILSCLFFINPTGILLYFCLITFFSIFLFKKNLIKNYLIIYLLPIILNLNIFLFIYFSYTNNDFFLGTHYQINNIASTLKDRIDTQLVPKSINFLLFPLNEIRNSLFYEFANNRPVILKLINISLIYFFIFIFIKNIYQYLFLKLNTSTLLSNKKYILLCLATLFLITGVNNSLTAAIIYYNSSIISLAASIYSNPGRYLYLLYFIVLWFGAMGIKKNRYLISILILTLVISNIFFDNKNNFQKTSEIPTSTQTYKVLYNKNLNNDKLDKLLNNPIDDFNFLVFPSPMNSWQLNPKTDLPWSSNFYLNSVFFLKPQKEDEIELVNNLYFVNNLDFIKNYFYNNSIRYLIINKSDKYFVYKNDFLKFDYSDLKSFNGEVYDITNYILNLRKLLSRHLVFEDENYYIYEFDYLKRVYGLSTMNKVINLDTSYLLNDFFLIKNINIKKGKILVTDSSNLLSAINFDNLFQLITKIINKDLIIFKNNLNKKTFELDELNEPSFIIIFNKYSIIYILIQIFSMTLFITLIIKIFRFKNVE